MNFPRNLPFIVKLSLVLVSILSLGILLILGQFILSPLLLAFLLAILFLPFANFLEKKLIFNRSLSTFASLLVILLCVYGTTWFFINQLSSFSEDWPHIEKQILLVFNDIQHWIKITFHLRQSKIDNYLNEGLAKLLSSGTEILSFLFYFLTSGIGFMLFFLLFFMFILNYRRILYKFILNVFPKKNSQRVQLIVAQIQNIIKKYIAGLFIQMILVSLISIVALSTIGVKYAILLGVLTGIINVIPYVGIVISAFIAALFSFTTGGPSQPLFVLLAYVGIHVVDANIILPFVVGAKVKINAMFSFIAILLGESLWGISGMFLSIPYLAIAKIIFDNVDELKPWGILIGEGEMRKFRRKRKTVVQTETKIPPNKTSEES